MSRLNQKDEWQEYLTKLRLVHKKKRRLMEILDWFSDEPLVKNPTIKTGKPKAELIRDGIHLLLEKETSRMTDSLLDLAGIGGAGGYPQASERHDDYLYVREEQAELGKKDE